MSLKIYKSAILFVALLYFSNTPLPIKFTSVSKQEAFNEWRTEFERIASIAPNSFKQTVSIYGQAGPQVYSFKFNPSEHSWDLLFRILELIDSSKIFTSENRNLDSTSQISLRVQGFGEEFTGSMPLSEGIQDSKLQILFKLLESKGHKESAKAVALTSKENNNDEPQPN